jgi:hypothetical protein
MKERPILFSSEMVRAILDGRKTQTRRVVNPQPDMVTRKGEPVAFKSIERINPETREFEILTHVPGEPNKKYCRQIKCPFGQVGDRLWVRETWADTTYFDPNDGGFVYKATDPNWADMEGWKWKPSIHMPREASRLTLEITGVRVERLNNISEGDAIAEGIESIGRGCWKDYRHQNNAPWCTSVYSFKSLWDSINSKKHPWANNDWVWVIEFKKSTVAHNS